MKIGTIGYFAVLALYSCNAGSAEMPFLQTQSSARTEAMGGAIAGMAGNSNSVFGNPAALSSLKGSELSFSHFEYYGGIRHETVSAVSELANGTALGLSLVYINNGEQDRRDIFGVRSGNFTPFQLVPTLSFSTAINKDISFGANVKVPYENIDDYSSAKVVFDLAAFLNVGEGFSAGINFQNLGLYENPPANLKAGMGYFSASLSAGLDLNCRPGGPSALGLGLEGTVLEGFPLRAGIKYDTGEAFNLLNSLSFGFGVKITQLSLDYAFKLREDLGNTHYVTAVVRFK